MIFSPTSNLHLISCHFCRNILEKTPRLQDADAPPNRRGYIFRLSLDHQGCNRSSPPRMTAETSLGSGIPNATIASWGDNPTYIKRPCFKGGYGPPICPEKKKSRAWYGGNRINSHETIHLRETLVWNSKPPRSCFTTIAPFAKNKIPAM